jgi:hypothetical protein
MYRLSVAIFATVDQTYLSHCVVCPSLAVAGIQMYCIWLALKVCLQSFHYLFFADIFKSVVAYPKIGRIFWSEDQTKLRFHAVLWVWGFLFSWVIRSVSERKDRKSLRRRYTFWADFWKVANCPDEEFKKDVSFYSTRKVHWFYFWKHYEWLAMLMRTASLTLSVDWPMRRLSWHLFRFSTC